MKRTLLIVGAALLLGAAIGAGSATLAMHVLDNEPWERDYGHEF